MQRQIPLLLNLLMITALASLLLFSGAIAAPVQKSAEIPSQQATPVAPTYLSVSSMAFSPFSERTVPYRRDFEAQILAIDSPTRQVENQNNWFVAPLYLPHGSFLTGITFFGQDLDSSGWIEIALWRCTHSGSSSCVNVPLSTFRTDEAGAGGNFDSGRIPLNEFINNQIYSYTLATRIVAINGSGIRSVLLEISEVDEGLPASGGDYPVGLVDEWRLPNRGNTTQLATGIDSSALIQICSNSTSTAEVEIQYGPNQTEVLLPGNCTRISGYSDYSLRHVGVFGRSASGTFEFLRN